MRFYDEHDLAELDANTEDGWLYLDDDGDLVEVDWQAIDDELAAIEDYDPVAYLKLNVLTDDEAADAADHLDEYVDGLGEDDQAFADWLASTIDLLDGDTDDEYLA